MSREDKLELQTHGQTGTAPGSKLPGALTDQDRHFSLVHYISTLSSAAKSGSGANTCRASVPWITTGVGGGPYRVKLLCLPFALSPLQKYFIVL